MLLPSFIWINGITNCVALKRVNDCVQIRCAYRNLVSISLPFSVICWYLFLILSLCHLKFVISCHMHKLFQLHMKSECDFCIPIYLQRRYADVWMNCQLIKCWFGAIVSYFAMCRRIWFVMSCRSLFNRITMNGITTHIHAKTKNK